MRLKTILFFKRIQKFYTEKIADMGIGAMIVFIAMVLVAGIAASVIIQTANSLEIQAMQTGQQTRDEIATGVHVTAIEGHKSGAGFDHLMITIKPRAGSLDIDLSQLYVEISDSTVKCVLLFLPSEFHMKSEIDGDLFADGFFDNLNATRFGIVVIEDADSSLSGSHPVLNRNDQVLATINCVSCFGGVGLADRIDVFGLIQPEHGASGVFTFCSPDIGGDTIYSML